MVKTYLNSGSYIRALEETLLLYSEPLTCYLSRKVVVVWQRAHTGDVEGRVVC